MMKLQPRPQFKALSTCSCITFTTTSLSSSQISWHAGVIQLVGFVKVLNYGRSCGFVMILDIADIASKCGRCSRNCGCGEARNLDVRSGQYCGRGPFFKSMDSAYHSHDTHQFFPYCIHATRKSPIYFSNVPMF